MIRNPQRGSSATDGTTDYTDCPDCTDCPTAERGIPRQIVEDATMLPECNAARRATMFAQPNTHSTAYGDRRGRFSHRPGALRGKRARIRESLIVRAAVGPTGRAARPLRHASSRIGPSRRALRAAPSELRALPRRRGLLRERCGPPRERCGPPRERCGPPRGRCGSPRGRCGSPPARCDGHPGERIVRKHCIATGYGVELAALFAVPLRRLAGRAEGVGRPGGGTLRGATRCEQGGVDSRRALR